jgi:hypothetical protein
MGDLANPNCKIDFMNAKTPVFYGSLIGGSHSALSDYGDSDADDPKKLDYIGAMVGWLRWQLAGDDSYRSMFVGTDCTLCLSTSGWIVQQKDLM